MIITAIKQFFSRKNAFLRNMLLSIVGLVCLPLIVIQLWLIHQTTTEYQSNNITSYLSALQANSNTYHLQTNLLSNTALRLPQDSKIALPLHNPDQVYSQLLTVNQLADYRSSSPFVDEVAIYYRPNGYVLSSRCKYTLADFCSLAAGNDSAAAAQLYGILDTVTAETYSASFPNSGYLIFAKPISVLSAATHDSVACFLVRTDDLARIFETSLPYDAGFCILNRDQESVLTTGDFPNTLFNNEVFLSFLSSNNAPSCEIWHEGEKLNLYRYQKSPSGETMLACVGADAAAKTLERYVNRLHLTLVLSLLFMCLLLTAAVYINYRPVKKLLSRHVSERRDSELSELELLDSLFFAKDERIANQQNLLSSFLISDLLFGVEVDPELLLSHFPRGVYQHFAVAAVSRVQLSSAQTNSVAALLRGQLGSVEFNTTRLPNSPRTLFIFMSSAPLNRTLLKERLLFAVHKITAAECAVQLGTTVDRIENLPKSHQSALSGGEELAEPDVLPNENPHIANEIQHFIHHVGSGNQEKALAALEKAEEILASPVVKENYRNYYCYKLLSAYLTAISENTVTLTEEELEPLMTFKSPVQLFTLMRQSVLLLCAKLQNAAGSAHAHQLEKLRQYVNDNITNSELCLTTAAEHMNLSIYAVSRLFKEATHKNFKEYITTERLTLAHDLLLSTEQSITEIASAVGFEDASYFSEVFKKHYHTVPTKLRNEAKPK